MKTNNERLKLR